jgi:hypothetical protein
VPVVEMHRDRDVVWIVHGGQAWRNAGIMVHQYPVVLSCCGDGGRSPATPVTTPKEP